MPPTVQGPTAQQHAHLPLLQYLESMSKVGLCADLPSLHGSRGLCDPRFANALPLGFGHPSLLHYPGASSVPLLSLAHGLQGLHGPTQADPSMLPLLPMSLPGYLPQHLQQLQHLQPQPPRALMHIALCSLPPTCDPPAVVITQQPARTLSASLPASAPSTSRSVPKQAEGGSGITATDAADETVCDTKTLKRKQANRDSARRSRLRREAQVGEMFVDVGQLEANSSELEQQLERLLAAASSLEAHNALLQRGIDLLEKQQELPSELRQQEQEQAEAVAAASKLLGSTPQTSYSCGDKGGSSSGTKGSSSYTKGSSSCATKGTSSSGDKGASSSGNQGASSSQARSSSQGCLLPLLQATDPQSAARARQTCKAWRSADAEVPYLVKAQLWDHTDMDSLACWFHCHTNLVSMELTTANKWGLGGHLERAAIQHVSATLPARQLQQLQLCGGAALPLMLLQAAILPSLTNIEFRSLPGKWSFTPGSFPWDASLARALWDHGLLQRRKRHEVGDSCAAHDCSGGGGSTDADQRPQAGDGAGDRNGRGLQASPLALPQAAPQLPTALQLASPKGLLETGARSQKPKAATTVTATIAANTGTAADANDSVNTAITPTASSAVLHAVTPPCSESLSVSFSTQGAGRGNGLGRDKQELHKLGALMYGPAVYARFSSYWRSYQLAAEVLVLCRGAALQDVNLEAPARCVALGIINSLAEAQRSAPQLRQLRLWEFGTRGNDYPSRCSGTEAGLRLDGLVHLAPSLTLLELEKCGTAAADPAVLECLTGLQVLSLPRSELLTQARPPCLQGLLQLSQLHLQHCQWLSEGRQGWSSRQARLALPSSVQQLDLTGFDGINAVDLAVAGRLRSLACLRSLSLTPTPQHRPETYADLRALTACRRGFRHFASAGAHNSTDAVRIGLTNGADQEVNPSLPLLCSLGLIDCLPGVATLRLFSGVQIGLTWLGFVGEVDDEEAVRYGVQGDSSNSSGGEDSEGEDSDGGDDGDSGGSDSSSSSSEGSVAPLSRREAWSFNPAPSQLPSLRELHLEVGTVGYRSLNLKELQQLTLLKVDNCEYIDLATLHLPSSLVHLSLKVFYGLPEMYYTASSDSHELVAAEERVRLLMARQVSGLPALEFLHATWNLLVVSERGQAEQAALCAPQLKHLELTSVYDVPEAALDALDIQCPLWESLKVADNRRKIIRMAPGVRLMKQEAEEVAVHS